MTYEDYGGPTLEYGCYYAGSADADAFSNFLNAVLQCGATFTGRARLVRGPNVRSKPYDSRGSIKCVDEVGLSSSGLSERLADPNVLVTRAYVCDPEAMKPSLAEKVIYHGISPEALGRDHHPIGLVTDGSPFFGPFPDIESEMAKLAGERAYRRLIRLIELTRPAYANLSCEYGLECPVDLQQDPRSYAFSDFYISEHYLGRAALAVVIEKYRGAYLEQVADGYYVSAYPFFNPSMSSIDGSEVPWLSMSVAQAIAERGPNPAEPGSLAR